MENTMAHRSTRKSPLLIESFSVMQSRYSPTTEIATLIHTFTPTFFFRKIPKIGTSTMYNAVIKPAFPTVVYFTPNCCRLDATHNAIPQQIPPMRRVFFSFSDIVRFSVTPSSFIFKRSRNQMHGISTIPPRIDRTQLNVNGPM